MKIFENIPLATHTTFKIGGPARFFCSVKNEAELIEAIRFAKNNNVRFFILGGGSNLLVSDQGFSGLVIKIEIAGISYDGDRVRAAAGEYWDELVKNTVERGFFGLENLSAIPGTVGAAAVQNIGAYGVDLSNVLESVRVLDTETSKFTDLSRDECKYGYRDSIFKQQKGRYVITQVTFLLNKHGRTNIAYKDLADYFNKINVASPTPEQVRQAVIEVRWHKLPDWKIWGTAGSFFKNPVIAAETFSKLKQLYPDLPGFKESDGRVKVSLGWILDKICNVKGLTKGRVSTYEKQALVIVAQPEASASEVVELSRELISKVRDKTGIEIEAEVEWVN